eukprot:6464000-Amphidinium_carterae.2
MACSLTQMVHTTVRLPCIACFLVTGQQPHKLKLGMPALLRHTKSNTVQSVLSRHVPGFVAASGSLCIDCEYGSLIFGRLGSYADGIYCAPKPEAEKKRQVSVRTTALPPRLAWAAPMSLVPRHHEASLSLNAQFSPPLQEHTPSSHEG